MPDDRSQWPVLAVDADTALDIALLLAGIRLPLAGPIRPGAAPGTVEIELDEDAGGLMLVDEESTPIAAVTRTGVGQGRLEAVSAPTTTPWQPYLGSPADVRAEVPADAVATLRDRPLTGTAHDQLASLGRPVLILAQIGGGLVPDELLVRSLAESVRQLPDARLVAVPLAQRNLTASSEADLAAQFGAAGVLAPLSEPAWAEVRAALDADAELPSGYGSSTTRAALRRWRAPLARRGVTVLFSGLSGSGKSTIAAAVMDEIAELAETGASGRVATLLDGDRVRRLLSSGLGFSRADRETNVRRIGWVAAQLTRLGGITLCAPIAPYASTRDWVRREVERDGDFFLVHVATPLAVCEARDRKGLYAAARAGRIPLFTGISDPYEEPTDADLVLDTTDRGIADCVAEVMTQLAARGWLTPKE